MWRGSPSETDLPGPWTGWTMGPSWRCETQWGTVLRGSEARGLMDVLRETSRGRPDTDPGLEHRGAPAWRQRISYPLSDPRPVLLRVWSLAGPLASTLCEMLVNIRFLGPIPGERLQSGGPWATLQLSFVWFSLC